MTRNSPRSSPHAARVDELDNLIDDLTNARISADASYKSHLDERARAYEHHISRTGSTPIPPSSDDASTKAAMQQLRRDSEQINSMVNRLESSLSSYGGSATGGGGSPSSTPIDTSLARGRHIKDLIQEEILISDEPQRQPREQQVDRKIVIRSRANESERHSTSYTSTLDNDESVKTTRVPSSPSTVSSKSSTPRSKRHVAFGGEREHEREDNETYDNEEGHRVTVSVGPRTSTAVSTSQPTETSTAKSSDHGDSMICHTCNKPIEGQVITALGHSYHREHFVCAQCGQELGTRNFYERENLPYCESDYHKLFSPKCVACGESIIDRVTIALEQTWHPEHFVCAHCGRQFDAESDEGFHERDGKPYCKEDFFALFANKCHACQLPITANYITALNVQWHPDCFVCTDCRCPFADGKFFDIDGAPYCEIHYHARRGSLCAVCRQPIIGRCITAMFRKFHPDHFTCTYCLKVLSKSFKEEADKPYCHDCFDKLYS